MHTPTHPYEVCTHKLQPYVQRYGGKFGPLEALRDTGGFGSNLLPTQYVFPGERYAGNASITRPLVRASHTADWNDLIGVLETLPAPGPEADAVNDVIARIRKQAALPEVIDFAEHSAGRDVYTPENVVLGVQQYIQGVRATVLSHPNRPKDDPEYVISWFRRSPQVSDDPLASGNEIYSATFDRRAKLKYLLGDSYRGKPQANMLPQKLIELYERVEGTRLTKANRSFVMETVGDENDVTRPPIVCQLRDFKERTVADWRLKDLPGYGASYAKFNLPKLVFGITPPEGVPLTVVHSPDGYGSDGATPLTPPDRPWAFLRTQHQKEPPLSFRTTNMEAYLGGYRFGSGMPSLAHSQERMANAAAVSVFENMADEPYAIPVPDDDYDFSRRLLAEMTNEPVWDTMRHTLDQVRLISAMYARNRTAWDVSRHNLLQETCGSTFSVILRSDGYSAVMDVAPGQRSRALRRPAASSG